MKKFFLALCLFSLVFAMVVPAVASSSGSTVVIRYEDDANGEVFESVRYAVSSGEPTPEFGGTPSRDGYTFEGWAPKWEPIASNNVVYVAQWKAIEDTTAATEVSTDESGNTVTQITANTESSTATTANEGRGDTIGSDVDTGDINSTVLFGGMAAALLLIVGMFAWRRKNAGSDE